MAIASRSEIAARIREAAAKNGGAVYSGDVQPGDIDFALSNGWLVCVSIGHFEITRSLPKG